MMLVCPGPFLRWRTAMRVSGHSIVTKIAGMSDLGELELLHFRCVSRRERQSGEGHGLTELGGEAPLKQGGSRRAERPGLEGVQPVRALLWVERERRDYWGP